MARNIEIKAQIDSIEDLLPRATALTDQAAVEIEQDDTFFKCDNGRLKLRTFADQTGELIFYRRADQVGPKESFYVRSPTRSPDTLREALTFAYELAGRVVKHRTLFLVGRTRIHLDRVQGLGDFLELEVVLDDDESAEIGVQEAETVLLLLGIGRERLVSGAYVDLLKRNPG